jgi:hypothetical protein
MDNGTKESASSVPASERGGERERFEAWAKIEGLFVCDGYYSDPYTVARWEAWQARAASPQTAPQEPVACWLIERGQQENHAPTVWLTADWEWTQDANKAIKFETAKDAAEHVATKHPHPFNNPTSKRFWPHSITEHMWLDAAAALQRLAEDGYGGRHGFDRAIDDDHPATRAHAPPRAPAGDKALLRDAARYRWILEQAVLTDEIFRYLDSKERHVSNAIDSALALTGADDDGR